MFGRTLASILITIPILVLIWVGVVVNNFLIANSFIADDYTMPICILMILLVLLGLNPLLSIISVKLRLTRRQLATILALSVMGAGITSSGLMRHSLYAMAWSVHKSNTDSSLAEAYGRLDPPPSLYPDSLEYDSDARIIGPFIDELAPDREVPWRAWIRPLLSWSGFLVPWFLMMIATSVIFFAYWRDVERLPMPLLRVHQALIDIPEKGGLIPQLFRKPTFWVACLTVFLFHSLAQGHRYWPSQVPTFPLHWNLWRCYTEEPWRNLPWNLKSGTIYFTFVGVAFFIPQRIGFSLWFGQLLYGLYVMLQQSYAPPLDYGSIADFRAASFLTFPCIVLWLARAHLLRVAKGMLTRPTTEEGKVYFIAAWSLGLGLLGMWAWLIWVHVPAIWAAGLVAIGFLSAVCLMRVLAETGLPLFFGTADIVTSFVHLIPIAWRSLAGMYFSGVLAVWYGPGQRICIGALATQALGIDKDNKPSQHIKLAGLFMAVLCISIVAVGAIQLTIAYHNSSNLLGERIASWGSGQFGLAEREMLSLMRGTEDIPAMDRLPHLITGIALTATVYAMYLISPQWPIHPVATICAGSWSVGIAAPSIFLAWLLKVLILRYGGASLYRKAGSVFLGLLLGEVFALIFWCLLGWYRGLNGMAYHSINIMPY